MYCKTIITVYQLNIFYLTGVRSLLCRHECTIYPACVHIVNQITCTHGNVVQSGINAQTDPFSDVITSMAGLSHILVGTLPECGELMWISSFLVLFLLNNVFAFAIVVK